MPYHSEHPFPHNDHASYQFSHDGSDEIQPPSNNRASPNTSDTRTKHTHSKITQLINEVNAQFSTGLPPDQVKVGSVVSIVAELPSDYVFLWNLTDNALAKGFLTKTLGFYSRVVDVKWLLDGVEEIVARRRLNEAPANLKRVESIRPASSQGQSAYQQISASQTRPLRPQNNYYTNGFQITERDDTKRPNSGVPYIATPGRFLSVQEAKIHLKYPRWTPPDSPIPETEEEVLECVQQLMEAMLDSSNIQDKRMTKFQMTQYSQEDFEARCWLVYHGMVKLHQNGCTLFPGPDMTERTSTDRNYSFQTRLAELCKLLKHWKCACQDIMDGVKIDHYIAAPTMHNKRKHINKVGNDEKAGHLKKGKAIAKQEKEQEKQIAKHKDDEDTERPSKKRKTAPTSKVTRDKACSPPAGIEDNGDNTGDAKSLPPAHAVLPTPTANNRGRQGVNRNQKLRPQTSGHRSPLSSRRNSPAVLQPIGVNDRQFQPGTQSSFATLGSAYNSQGGDGQTAFAATISSFPQGWQEKRISVYREPNVQLGATVHPQYPPSQNSSTYFGQQGPSQPYLLNDAGLSSQLQDTNTIATSDLFIPCQQLPMDQAFTNSWVNAASPMHHNPNMHNQMLGNTKIFSNGRIQSEEGGVSNHSILHNQMLGNTNNASNKRKRSSDLDVSNHHNLHNQMSGNMNNTGNKRKPSYNQSVTNHLNLHNQMPGNTNNANYNRKCSNEQVVSNHTRLHNQMSGNITNASNKRKRSNEQEDSNYGAHSSPPLILNDINNDDSGILMDDLAEDGFGDGANDAV
ncbi:hypothetical protein M501DRAFT_1020795 [Patellaria atrata CBS 101060]|uniref:Uncharacterized protein n=1 Tax=Patellaria atrata CBS 101060 TaxID=1346257 RepID=A0A9P4VKG2_9PEZI|nr:hypothetical protein M501DRAFT_1020795 [Patellaria atrata CBS 101060]